MEFRSIEIRKKLVDNALVTNGLLIMVLRKKKKILPKVDFHLLLEIVLESLRD